MVRETGARILVLLVLLTASALIGVCLLFRQKNFIQLTQGVSDRSSDDRTMKLHGDHLAQFEMNNADYAPRKISYQHRQTSPGNSSRLSRLLWEVVTKRRAVHQAATRRQGNEQIIWSARLLLSEATESLTGVIHLSTPIKAEKLPSTNKHEQKTSFRGYHRSPDTGNSDPVFHVDYAGPGPHPPHSH